MSCFRPEHDYECPSDSPRDELATAWAKTLRGVRDELAAEVNEGDESIPAWREVQLDDGHGRDCSLTVDWDDDDKAIDRRVGDYLDALSEPNY